MNSYVPASEWASIAARAERLAVMERLARANGANCLSISSFEVAKVSSNGASAGGARVARVRCLSSDLIVFRGKLLNKRGVNGGRSFKCAVHINVEHLVDLGMARALEQVRIRTNRRIVNRAERICSVVSR